MVTGKQRSTEKERLARKELEEQGYLVTRAGASLGIFDLVAIGKTLVKLIQIKRTKLKKIPWSRYYKTMCELQEKRWPNSCSIELWIWVDLRGWTKLCWGLGGGKERRDWYDMQTHRVLFPGHEIKEIVKKQDDK